MFSSPRLVSWKVLRSPWGAVDVLQRVDPPSTFPLHKFLLSVPSVNWGSITLRVGLWEHGGSSGSSPSWGGETLSPSRFLVAHRSPKGIAWEVVVGERALQGARMRQLPDNAHELGGNNGQCRATPQTRSHRGTCTALRLPLGSVDSCPLNCPSCTTWWVAPTFRIHPVTGAIDTVALVASTLY